MPHTFIPVPNTASVEMIFQSGPFTAQNNYHVQGDAPLTILQCAVIRGLFDNWDNVDCKARRNTAWSLTRIRTRALDSIEAPYEDYSLVAARAGTGGAAQMIASGTFCVKLLTGLTGRSRRGRMYWVGAPPPATNAQGVFSLAQAQGFVAALNELISILNDAGYPLVITSFMSNHVYRVEGVNTPVTLATYSDLNADNQRRRLPGRGIS